jgi:hypothetical protein
MLFAAPSPSRRRFLPVLAVAAGGGVVSAFAVSSAQAQTLTDLVLFRSDTNGNTIQEGWNTVGADAISNLYLTSGVTPVNSGNAAGASVAIDLSAPGSYTFSFAGDNVNTNTTPPLAINFFFNNNVSTPGISARGVTGGGFFANSGNTNTPPFGQVTGANTLTFTNNGLQIALTAFTFNTNGANLVSPFNNTPGGTNDSTGSFTLTVTRVTAAPEASSLAFLALGSGIGSGVVKLRRRKR